MILIAECKDCGQITQLIPPYGVLKIGNNSACPRENFIVYSNQNLEESESILQFKEKYPDIKVKTI